MLTEAPAGAASGAFDRRRFRRTLPQSVPPMESDMTRDVSADDLRGDDVSARVVRILAEQAMLDVEDLKPETTLEDLALDSLALVEVIFAIEETFDVNVPFNANEPAASEFDLSTVAKIIDGVKKLIAEKG
jgi:acyl carrier protein